MKHIIAIAAGILVFAFTMCFAQAADQTYKTSDGQAFGLHNVYKIEGGIANTYVRVTYANGGDNLFFDAGGAVYTKIVQNNPQFVAVGNQVQIDPSFFARILCQSGTSRFALQGSSVVIDVGDSCTSANQAIAKAK